MSSNPALNGHTASNNSTSNNSINNNSANDSSSNGNSQPLSFPLTFAQRRLWFLNQLEGASNTYHLKQVLSLKGELDRTALVQAVNDVVNRHEILRTTFQTVDGTPFQVISKVSSVSIEFFDFQNAPESERLSTAQQTLKEYSDRPFSLEQGPLLRIALAQLDATDYLLFITMHHIITDAWSMNLLKREIAAGYSARRQGLEAALPELTIQYGDFADWQRDWLSGDTLEKQLSYWKTQLAGIPAAIELPTDYPRPAVQTYSGASQTLKLSDSLTSGLKAIAQNANATLFMTLLAAFATLLHRYSNQKDIVIGSPSAGRDRPEIENLIGFFVNTLVLKTSFQESLSFKTLLDQVREMALDAFTHQDMPFEKLVEALQPERDLGRSPLFQVWFNMLNLSENSTTTWPGLEVKPSGSGELASKFDLTMYVFESEKQIKFNLVYNTDLFKPERITLLLEQFEYLLEQIVCNPDLEVSRFSLVTAATAPKLPNPQRVLIEPSSPEAQALTQLALARQISDRANRTPQRLAISDLNNQLTYGELESLSNQVANALVSQNIQPQETVAVYARRSAGLAIALLSIWKAGAAFVILDAAYPTDRLIGYLEMAKPVGCIVLESTDTLPTALQAALDKLSLKSQFYLPEKLTPEEISTTAFASQSQHRPDVSTDTSDLAYIAFTSGTTGKPKAILGTHAPLSHFISWHAKTFNLNAGDRFCLLSGLAHDPLLRDIFTPLCLGAPLYIPDQVAFESAGLLADWMVAKFITVAHLTPAVGQLLRLSSASSKRPQLDSLRYAFFGGDVLTRQDVEKLKAIAPNTTCVNFYGATETPQVSGFYIVPERPESRSLEKLPVGTGIEGTQLLILNKARQQVGIGEIGEIWVRSPYLAKGYLNNAIETQKKFVENPFLHNVPNADRSTTDRCYRTGDLSRYALTGEVNYIGRQDRQVNIRGFRVELKEIESVISQSSDVAEVTVIHHKAGDKSALYACVVPAQHKDVEAPSMLKESLKQRAAQELPVYMIPSRWMFLEAMPLTPNGKLDYQALVEQEDQYLHTTPVVEPSDRLEEQLIRIWQQVLGIEKVSVTDNFFDLGGHSLLAIQLFNEIERTFGKKLPLATLFQAPNIKSISEIVRQENWLAPWESLVAIKPKGTKPPLFYLHAGGGNLLFYRKLIDSLADDQPVYGLQPRGLNGEFKPSENIREMASFYISQMETVQPQGPYYLAGLSTGGLIAWEIASQLAKKGQETGLLVLLDAYGRRYPKLLPLLPRIVSVVSWAARDLAHRVVRLPRTAFFEIKTQGLKTAFTSLLVKLRVMQPQRTETQRVQEKIINRQISRKVNKYNKSSSNISRLEKLINTALAKLLKMSSKPYYANTFTSGLFVSDVSKLPADVRAIRTANFQARKAYKAQSFKGNIVLFRASKRPPGIVLDPYLGWKELATGNIVTYEISGTHTSIVNSAELADILNKHLNEAQAKSNKAQAKP